jgi:hypothetical protein
MLRAAGYDAAAYRALPAAIVTGRRGRCRILIGDYPPHGTLASMFARLAAPIGPERFAWRGTVTARPPGTSALLRFFAERELRRIGLATARSPIAAIAASPGCGIDDIDWHGLETIADERAG